MIFSNCFMVKSIQKKAFEFCFKNKHRYTEPRKKVLEIVSSSKKPLKAYEILEKLGLELNNPKPPTAYRAIEFWQKYNFIHRIESLNAYSACISDHLHSGTQFMICDDCGKVMESTSCELPSKIQKELKKKQFRTTKWNLEISGQCNDCS